MAVKNNTVALLAKEFDSSGGNTKRKSKKTGKMTLFLEDEYAKDSDKTPRTPAKSKKTQGVEESTGIDIVADSPAKSTRSKKTNPLAETQKLQAMEYFQRKKTLQSSQKARRSLSDFEVNLPPVLNVAEQEEQTNVLQQSDQHTGLSHLQQSTHQQPNVNQQEVYSQQQTSQPQPDSLQQQLPCLSHQQQQISHEPTSHQQPYVSHQLPGPSIPQQEPTSQHLNITHQLPAKPQLIASQKQQQISHVTNLQPPFQQGIVQEQPPYQLSSMANNYHPFHQQPVLPVLEEQSYWSAQSQSLSSAVADGLGTINSACDMCEGYRKHISLLETEMEQLKQENQSLKDQKGIKLYRELKDLVDKYGRDDARSPSPILSSASMTPLRSPLASPETSSTLRSSVVSPKADTYNSEPVADVLESVEGHKNFLEPGENKIKLLEGYSLYIDATKLQAMKSKAKKNPTKLLRELLSYFFTEEYLASHSATGAKSPKKGLPREIIQPIREFMSKHYKYEDTNIVVNRKSLDLNRKIMKIKSSNKD